MNSKLAGMATNSDLYDFFYNELRTLKARTGFNQWDKIHEAGDPAREIDSLIGYMIDECNKPPFDQVKDKTVLQRVIHAAVVEDPDFIGLNARFVKRVLHKWWEMNGTRVLEQRDKKPESVYTKVELTKEQNEKVNVLLNSYLRTLLSGPGLNSVPKLQPEQVTKEGAEWKSDIERKGVAAGYKPPPKEYFDLKDKIRRAASEYYKSRHTFSKMAIYIVNGYDVFAETPEQAEEIYNLATQTE